VNDRGDAHFDPDEQTLTDWVQPLDWPAVLAEEDDAASEWLLEPIAPAGAHVAIWARAGVGKSLLLLECAAALACGKPVLGGPTGDAIDVVYVDMESPIADLRARMLDLGYTPTSDLKRFHYFHMPALPPLDTDLGGAVVAAQVARFAAQLVVVDTTSSSVRGKENDSDTFRDFHRHTGRRLRASGTTLIRLDHAGKDRTKGQRGSSAKDDDMDVVFEMTDTGGTFVLRRTKSRMPWVPPEVRLRREPEPVLRHLLTPVDLPEGTTEVADLLDTLGVPPDATGAAAQRALRQAGTGRRRDVVLAALRHRKRPR
jgi:RecA-family ATPase